MQETQRDGDNRYLLPIQVADVGKLNSELVSEKERLRKELEKARSESGTLRRKRVSSEKVSSYSDIM